MIASDKEPREGRRGDENDTEDPPRWVTRAADWLMRRIVGRAEAIEVGVPRVTGGGGK